jgi:hypothetical protein
MRKLVLIFATMAIAAAGAAANTYHFRLQQPAIFSGMPLQPGDYKIQVEGGKAMLKMGKTVIEAPAQLETAEHKYPATTIDFDGTSTNKSITEIHVGGSTTRIVISGSRTAGQ